MEKKSNQPKSTEKKTHLKRMTKNKNYKNYISTLRSDGEKYYSDNFNIGQLKIP
jgi:hypothetical protein